MNDFGISCKTEKDDENSLNIPSVSLLKVSNLSKNLKLSDLFEKTFIPNVKNIFQTRCSKCGLEKMELDTLKKKDKEKFLLLIKESKSNFIFYDSNFVVKNNLISIFKDEEFDYLVLKIFDTKIEKIDNYLQKFPNRLFLAKSFNKEIIEIKDISDFFKCSNCFSLKFDKRYKSLSFDELLDLSFKSLFSGFDLILSTDFLKLKKLILNSNLAHHTLNTVFNDLKLTDQFLIKLLIYINLIQSKSLLAVDDLSFIFSQKQVDLIDSFLKQEEKKLHLANRFEPSLKLNALELERFIIFIEKLNCRYLIQSSFVLSILNSFLKASDIKNIKNNNFNISTTVRSYTFDNVFNMKLEKFITFINPSLKDYNSFSKLVLFNPDLKLKTKIRDLSFLDLITLFYCFDPSKTISKDKFLKILDLSKNRKHLYQ